VEEHAEELEDEYDGEEDEEDETEDLYFLVGPVVELADGDDEVGEDHGDVLELELHDDPEGVEHEECEAGVVAELDQVLGDALLFLDVLVERVQVLGEKAFRKETMSKSVLAIRVRLASKNFSLRVDQ